MLLPGPTIGRIATPKFMRRRPISAAPPLLSSGGRSLAPTSINHPYCYRLWSKKIYCCINFCNMTPEQKQQPRNLIKKHNIHFDGTVGRSQWPAAHSQTFSNIQKLGRTEFTLYRESITIDSDAYPWRNRLSGEQRGLRPWRSYAVKVEKNEVGWRMLLESKVLARFTIEVACRKCRARL
jgi:hypothetical protein